MAVAIGNMHMLVADEEGHLWAAGYNYKNVLGTQSANDSQRMCVRDHDNVVDAQEYNARTTGIMMVDARKNHSAGLTKD